MNTDIHTDSKFSDFCKETMNTDVTSEIVRKWVNGPDVVKRTLGKMIQEAGKA